MSKIDKIEYLKLPIDLKKEIQLNLSKNLNLKKGFYSELYSITINQKEANYRFHAVEIKNKKSFTIIFSSKEKKHKPFIKGKNIFFFDKELKKSLKVDCDLVQNISEKEINFNLSLEQKELLFLGHEITLEVNQKNKSSNFNLLISKVINTKKEKRYIADYTFFLGKCSLLLRESKIQKNNINILKHERH